MRPISVLSPVGRALLGRRGEGAHARQVQVRHGLGREVAHDDAALGVGGLPGGDVAVGQAVGLAVAEQETGADQEQGFHGGFLVGMRH